MVKNPPAYAGDPTEAILIPGLGRSPEIGSGTPHCSILAFKILWTEESGKLQAKKPQKVGHD